MNSASGNTEPISASAIERVLSEIDHLAAPGVLNCRATLERLDGDLELFRDLLGFYFRDVPMLLREISTAISTGDGVAVRRWSHRLKGLVGNFDARLATHSASELEQMGVDGQLAGADTVYGRLEAELADVTLHLRRFLLNADRA